MRVVSRFLAAALVVFVTGPAARAVDQTILGSQLLLKNPSTVVKRKLVGKAKEKASPNTISGNPTATGATLIVTANGGTSGNQTFVLPTGSSGITGKPFWSGDATKGFKYKDPKLENSAIKGLTIKKSGGGVFSISVKGDGKNSPGSPITVLPPNPGVSGCILLTFPGGDSYSVKFGAGDGTVTNKGAAEYKHKKVTAEGTCVTTTTSSTTPTTTSSTTTTTTIPACSPNCVLGQACLTNANCLSQTCSGGFCRCPTTSFPVTMNSVGDGGDFDLSHEWPGGNTGNICATGGECCVNLSRPSGNIDTTEVGGDQWGIAGVVGFTGGCSSSFCANNPTCNALAAIPRCQPTGVNVGRPSCSSGLGSASHSINVTCLQ